MGLNYMDTTPLVGTETQETGFKSHTSEEQGGTKDDGQGVGKKDPSSEGDGEKTPQGEGGEGKGESKQDLKHGEGDDGQGGEKATITESALQRRLARQERRHQREIQEQASRFEERLAAVEKGVKEATRKPKPQQADFETTEEYVDALVDWKMENGGGGQDNAKREKTQERRESRKEGPTSPAEFQDAVDELKDRGREKYKDWNEVLDAEGVTITTSMAIAIMETSHDIDVAYYLAKNPKEGLRIARIKSPVQQAMEIRDIENMFRKKVQTQTNTNEFKGIKPVGGGREVKTEPTEYSKMSYAQFRKKRGFDKT